MQEALDLKPNEYSVYRDRFFLNTTSICLYRCINVPPDQNGILFHFGRIVISYQVI